MLVGSACAAFGQRLVVVAGQQQPLHIFRVAGSNADAAGIAVHQLAAVLSGFVDADNGRKPRDRDLRNLGINPAAFNRIGRF